MGISDKYDALVPTSMDQLINLADRIAKSTLIPREYQGKPADCLLAMSMGLEIGLKPIQALQSIAVINNRPCLWGTAARALVMADARLESLFETEPAVVDKTGVARCEIMRKGHADPFVGEFSLDNARKAQLIGKDNYSKYPGQMLTWRAFHMAAKKAFPDIYKGLAPAEEMQEMAASATPADNAGTVTLALDAPSNPVTQEELDQSKREFPDKRRRGRSPKHDPTSPTGLRDREPQAPQKAAEVTPLSPAVAASPPTLPESCGFCHKIGHSFNECPENKAAESVETSDMPTNDPPTHTTLAANGRTLNDEEQAEIIKLARTLRPVSFEKFINLGLRKLGVEKLPDLPVDEASSLMRWMDTNA